MFVSKYNIVNIRFIFFTTLVGFFVLSQIDILISSIFIFIGIFIIFILSLNQKVNIYQEFYILLFIFICSQYLMMTLFSSYSGIEHIKFLFAINYIFLVSFIVINIYKFKKISNLKIIKNFTIFIILLFINILFLSDKSQLLSIITILRNYSTFIFAFVIGFSTFKYMKNKNYELLLLINIFNRIFLIVLIFSLFDVFLFTDEFTAEYLKVNYYAEGTGIIIPDSLGLPLDYFTTFYEYRKIRRAASVFFGPNNTGYFSSFIIILNIFYLINYNRKKYIIYILLGIILLLLSFSKTNWLYIGLIMSSLTIGYLSKKIIKLYLFIFLLLVSLIFYKTAILDNNKEFSSSGMSAHILGAIQPFLNSNMHSSEFFIGHGIGSGGTASRLLGSRNTGLSKAEVGGESTIGSMFYQIGLFGLIIFLYHFKILIQIFSYNYKSNKYLYILSISIVVGYFFNAVLQENSFAFIPSFLIYFLFGLIYGHSYLYRKESK